MRRARGEEERVSLTPLGSDHRLWSLEAETRAQGEGGEGGR